jgi:hypothetical protein
VRPERGAGTVVLRGHFDAAGEFVLRC